MRGGPDYSLKPDGMRVIPLPNGMVSVVRLDEPPVSPPSGPPEVFTVPVEMALYQANATGQMFLRRWREMGATFARSARVWRVGDRLVAEVSFVAPVGPENQTGCVVQMGVALWENLA